MGMFGSGFGTEFALFRIMFLVVFVIVIGTFVVTAVKGFQQWNKNNHSPRLTVPATVVAKRTHVSRHRHRSHSGSGMHHTSFSTSYYVTFQVESGDRMELALAGQEFGLLVEGDKGNLSFQGTRYLGFERT